MLGCESPLDGEPEGYPRAALVSVLYSLVCLLVSSYTELCSIYIYDMQYHPNLYYLTRTGIICIHNE